MKTLEDLKGQNLEEVNKDSNKAVLVFSNGDLLTLPFSGDKPNWIISDSDSE